MPNITRPKAESARIEAFSDGVFAVAITLLVLNLRAPETPGNFFSELLTQWPSYVAYIAAFLYIGIVWIEHHSLFTIIRRVDSTLIARNLLHLLITSSIPFITAVASNSLRGGNRSDLTAAVFLFGSISIVLIINWYGLCRYLERTPHLLTNPAAVAAVRHDRVRQPGNLIIPIVAMGIALFNPLVSLGCMSLFPLLYFAALWFRDRGTKANQDASTDEPATV